MESILRGGSESIRLFLQRAIVGARLANMERTDTLRQGSRSANLPIGNISQQQAADMPGGKDIRFPLENPMVCAWWENFFDMPGGNEGS